MWPCQPAPRLPIQIYFRICFNGRMTEEHAYWTDTVQAHRCCNPLGAARRCHYQRLPASIPAPSRRLPHTPPPRCSCLLHIPDLALVARHCLHLGSHSIGRRLKTTSQPLQASLWSLWSLWSRASSPIVTSGGAPFGPGHQLPLLCCLFVPVAERSADRVIAAVSQFAHVRCRLAIFATASLNRRAAVDFAS